MSFDPAHAEATMVDLFEAQAARSPDAVAVESAGGETLRYAELDARANQVAHLLVGLGVGPEVVVGISCERSLEMAVGLLAILKAGGACLALDPSYPTERLAFMLDDAAAPVVVTQAKLLSRLPAGGARVVVLDGDAGAVAELPTTAPARSPGADHLAYVIYTSGSTGVPRGVLLEHRALVNHNLVAASLYDLGPSDRVLQFCSISFDVSIEELFPTWAAGATVVLRPDDLPLLGRAWSQWLAGAAVTVLNLPTAYWHEWVRDLAARGEEIPPALRLVVVGGEQALAGAYASWLEVGGRRARWLNAYGPTEAAVMATIYEPPAPGAALAEDEGPSAGPGDPPIGRALPGVSVHLLGQNGEPVAPGESGEIHIGGVGLARGYLGRPGLSAERFVDDPFSSVPGARLYRSGDLARARPDGNLEFLGRLDAQVKVRGFRIECGEVEAALRTHPDVDDAVVVAREDAPGDRRLVAYVVGCAGGRGGDPGAVLRRFLAARLPGHMVPTAFVAIETLPLTANGKVDREALPAPEAVPTRRLGPAPATPTEAVVATVWSTVLRLDGAGGVVADDDFFDLGGHSLLATQVIAQLREALGLEIPLRVIFETPTVAGLARSIDRIAGGAAHAGPALVPQARSEVTRVPLALNQEQMFRLETETVGQGRYNVTALHRFDEAVEVPSLRQAIALVVDRHEALRTSFPTDEAGPFQRIVPALSVELAVHDLRGLPLDERDQQLNRLVAHQDVQTFPLDRLPLFRTTWAQLEDQASQLVATFDHLICDGTSAYIFLNEVTAAYRALAAGQGPDLRPLPIQYADYALWQRHHLTADRLAAQLEYWKVKLDAMPTGPAIPFDRIPATPTRRIAARELTLGGPTYRSLHQRARDAQSTIFVVCVAAVQALCSRSSQRSDVVLSTTLSGRQRSELEGLMGSFSGVGRLRTDLGGDPTFEEVLARARDTVLGLFEHQDIPFLQVRDAILTNFPTAGKGLSLMAALPVELQYFHVAPEGAAPGLSMVPRPGSEPLADDLYFRGQLHPLSITFLDDGAELWGELSYKVDFYDEATVDTLAGELRNLVLAVAGDPQLRISELPVTPRPVRP